MQNTVNRFDIAIDTGKALTKSYYRKQEEDGKLVGICDKFPSAIGMANINTTGDRVKPFSTSLLEHSYYVGIPGLCNITPTEDNEKNGTGNTGNESGNHDREIVTLCAAQAICRAMRDLGIRNAYVNVAIGMPITEFSMCKDHRRYFESILPANKPIDCTMDGVRYMFIIRKHIVCPETLSAFINNDGGSYGNTILVDIGGNNVQFICYSDGHINYDNNKTTTVKGGANNLIRRVSEQMVIKQVEPVGSYSEIMHWIIDPKSIKFGDKWKERFSEIVTSEKIAYLNRVNDVFNTVSGKYKDEILRGYKVCYTGGGSVLLKNEIKSIKGAIIFSGGEYANVKGFYEML